MILLGQPVPAVGMAGMIGGPLAGQRGTLAECSRTRDDRDFFQLKAHINVPARGCTLALPAGLTV
jgi:hypothetical protein